MYRRWLVPQEWWFGGPQEGEESFCVTTNWSYHTRYIEMLFVRGATIEVMIKKGKKKRQPSARICLWPAEMFCVHPCRFSCSCVAPQDPTPFGCYGQALSYVEKLDRYYCS